MGSFSQREVTRFGAPSLITRETNDVQQVQMLVLMSCTLMVAAPIMMVGVVVMAMREDLGLSWLLAVAVPALVLVIGLIIRRMVPGFRAMQGRIDEVNRLLREQITGVRVVRAFVREPYETQRFADANGDLTDVSIRAGRWLAAMFPAVMLIANVSSVAVLWFGGHRVEDGQMQVGPLTAYLAYLMQILMSVMMGIFMLMMVPFYEVTAGRITLDGVDVASVPRSELRRQTGMVLQDTWLFAGTIRDNIAYGNPGATPEQVMEAARATFVDRFVHSLPDGYDTVVDENGSNLSAGERQLVTIARAFVSDPALLILDEATSSVDTRTELLLQQAMRALRSDRTSFVIAHRLSMIRDADLILVMESGAIVEQGSHDELLAAGGAYARLHASQFSGASV